MENVLVDDANDAGEAYELLHMLRIETDYLTSLNASVIHVAVSKAGNCSLDVFHVELHKFGGSVFRSARSLIGYEL